MNETSSTRPRRARRWIVAAMIAVTTITASLVAGAPATAATYGAGTGQPGAVGTGVIVANGTEKPWTIYGHTFSASLRMPNLTIYRSAATSGAQSVGITYRLMRWDGYRWVAAHTTQMYTATIAAGQSAVSIDQGIRLVASYSGHYYMEVDVVWAIPGYSLGGRRILFNQPGDFRCFNVSGGQNSGMCAVYNAGYVLVS